MEQRILEGASLWACRLFSVQRFRGQTLARYSQKELIDLELVFIHEKCLSLYFRSIEVGMVYV